MKLLKLNVADFPNYQAFLDAIHVEYEHIAEQYGSVNVEVKENEMAAITVTKALTGYFNVEPRKVSAQEWLKELKALQPEEKRELAEAVVALSGDTLTN